MSELPPSIIADLKRLECIHLSPPRTLNVKQIIPPAMREFVCDWEFPAELVDDEHDCDYEFFPATILDVGPFPGRYLEIGSCASAGVLLLFDLEDPNPSDPKVYELDHENLDMLNKFGSNTLSKLMSSLKRGVPDW